MTSLLNSVSNCTFGQAATFATRVVAEAAGAVSLVGAAMSAANVLKSVGGSARTAFKAVTRDNVRGSVNSAAASVRRVFANKTFKMVASSAVLAGASLVATRQLGGTKPLAYTAAMSLVGRAVSLVRK